MKSLFFFLLDMVCAAVDGALHVFEDDDESSQSPTTDLIEETR